ncbi:MAG: hypothetical protein AMXMBFR47_25830 [Planctomycetota bacterium]
MPAAAPRRALALSAFVALASLALPERAAADDSLAKEAPAESGLFVELRNGADLLAGLLEPQLWTTLAEVAGQPARVEDVDEWRKQIQRAIHVEPLAAIQTLFARCVAFVGDGLGKSQDGVVICRPVEPPPKLIEQFKGTRLADIENPPTYHLYNTIGVIARDDLLFFGALLPEDSLLHRMRPIAAGEQRPRLAADPVYRALLARAPADPDGVLFLRIPGRARPSEPASQPAASAPSSQPASAPASRPARPRIDLPGPLENAENVLLALHREGARLHFTAVGDRTGAPAALTSRPAGRGFIAALPDDTLAAWEGFVDFNAFAEAAASLPEQGLIRAVLGPDPDGKLVRRWAETVDGATCVAVGAVAPARANDPPPIPAIACIIGARDAAAAAATFGEIVNGATQLINIAQLARGAPPLDPPTELTLPEGSVWLLNLTPVIARVDAGAIGELHLAWTASAGRLIIASHTDWLRRIISIPPEKTLAATLARSRQQPSPASMNVVLLRLGPLASLGAKWLEFFQRTAPEILTDAWWRTHQPRGNPRLGCEVTGTDDSRLIVTKVFPGQAVDGRLQPGDHIVGANGKRFATSQPIPEVREAIDRRPHGAYVELMVERDGKLRHERVPLPYADPIRSLRRLVAIGSMIDTAIYIEDAPQPEGPRGFLTLDLGPPPASQAAPSQPAATPPPVTQPAPATEPAPATQPASPPAAPAPPN